MSLRHALRSLARLKNHYSFSRSVILGAIKGLVLGFALNLLPLSLLTGIPNFIPWCTLIGAGLRYLDRRDRRNQFIALQRNEND